MIDLFGLEQQPKRIHDMPVAAALVEVLKALNTHPAAAWCESMNSGAAAWVHDLFDSGSGAAPMF